MIHPDDVLAFEEVRQAMFRVAKRYDLKLTAVIPEPKPEFRDAWLGTCDSGGTITITMRGMESGVWSESPRRPQEIWCTAAHELAHLRHLNHGVDFQEFEEEMQEAVENQTEDHREKVIRRLVKMQAQRDGEAKLGNDHAAEAFAAAVNRMMLAYELKPSDLDYARAKQDDPVIQVLVDQGKHSIERKRTRVAWQETLARVVAKAHLCSFLIRTGSNDIWLVGTKSHVTVAEYVFGILAREADKLADKEYAAYFRKCHGDGDASLARGFRAAWLTAFVQRVDERLQEERATAVATAPGGESVALMRIDGALIKVKEYMDARFHRKRSHAAALNGGRSYHTDGRAWGRAAADRMAIGRKGVAAPVTRGFLCAASKGRV
jgi:hypothetical protein